MIVGSIKEDLSLEKRVSITPETAKNIINLGLKICIENDYATHIGIKDSEYKDVGVEIKNSSNEVLNISNLLLKVNCPSTEEISNLKDKTILIGMLNPSKNQSKFKEILKRTGIESTQIDECVMGNILGAGQGQNPARQVALGAGLDYDTPSYTLNRVCASGVQSVANAAQAIKAGDADVVLAGGIENMNLAPFLLPIFTDISKLPPCFPIPGISHGILGASDLILTISSS